MKADGNNVFLGDTLTGVLEAPRSDNHRSACLVAWRHADSNFEMRLEFQQLGGGFPTGSIKLNPAMLFTLPILAADHFGDSPNPPIYERGGGFRISGVWYPPIFFSTADMIAGPFRPPHLDAPSFYGITTAHTGPDFPRSR